MFNMIRTIEARGIRPRERAGYGANIQLPLMNQARRHYGDDSA